MAEQELRDLEVQRNDIGLDDGGDLAFVTGMDNVKQSVALDIRDVTHFDVGGTLTSDTTFALRDEIKRSLQTDPQITTPITVELDSVDKNAGVVNFAITTRDNEEFTIDMVLPD